MPRQYAGKVHALGVSDNRDGVRMSALAAASLVAAEGVEPILHVATRDRNRIALASECLGAAGPGRSQLAVHDRHAPDAGRLPKRPERLRHRLRSSCCRCTRLARTARWWARRICRGPVRSAWARPRRPTRTRWNCRSCVWPRRSRPGRSFVITQPVFDVERFETWWSEVTRRGLHEKVAILAGIQPLADAEAAKAYAARRPQPDDPGRHAAASVPPRATPRRSGPRASRSRWRPIRRLSQLKGLRGFEIRGDGDADLAIEFIEKSGLGVD